MLSFSDPAVYQSSKCYLTHGTMAYIDARQPPTKGKPWGTISSLGSIHKVKLVDRVSVGSLQSV
jgi:ribonuclease P/MRP protein subunit RPP40